MGVLEKQAIELIKAKARAIQLTQVKVAEKIGVSIPTVKRWWVGQGVTLSVLNDLAGLVGISISQLFLELEGGGAKYFYSLAQEQILVNSPKILALFDLLVSGESVKGIQKKFAIKTEDLFSMLLKLDKIGLIELYEHNKVKLKNRGEPQWIVDGPLSKKYRRKMIDSFLGDHLKSEMSFFIHDYLPEDEVLISGKMRELENLMQTCNVRSSFTTEHTNSYGVYLSMKKFEWDLRGILESK